MGPLDHVCCARLPRAALAGVAELRTAAQVAVIDSEDGFVWLQWPACDVEVLRYVLPLAGAELYAHRGEQWFRADSLLPTEGPPITGARRLDRVLQPAPFQPAAPPATLPAAARLRLVRDGRPRSATALRCSLKVLAGWADWAPSGEIAAVRGVWSGGEALLFGEALPWFADSERFWGRRVFVPLGWRPEPALPESALASLLGLDADALGVLHEDRVEVVPETALRSLTRGSIRRASRGRTEATA